MRLFTFLTEKLTPEVKYEREYGATYEQVYNTITKDCSHFLKESGGAIAWRGSAKKYSPTEPIDPYTARIPRNTDKHVHDYLNKRFHEKFGWKVRSGVFAVGGDGPSAIYGHKHLFFPIGTFKFVWSPSVPDLFKKPLADPNALNLKGISWRTYFENKESSFNRLINSYRDSNLIEALKSANEISFKVKKYYMVKKDFGLMEYLLKKGLIHI